MEKGKPGPHDLSDEISATFETLPRYAIRDFTLLDVEGNPAEGALGDIHIFDCELDENGLPLMPTALRTYVPTANTDISSSSGFFDNSRLFLIGRAGTTRKTRIIAMTNHALDECISPIVIERERINLSELRLLKQLLCGLNLSEAASNDAVSHETKRSQYKSLARKLSARSQSDITARVMTQILLTLKRAGNEEGDGADTTFASLIRRFIPSSRTFYIDGEQGRRHRFIDIGPISGRPAIMLHSQILPDLRDTDIAALHANDLRLIIPMRNGALAPSDAGLSPPDHMDHACEGIDLARASFCGPRAHIMACISGGAYGVQYAARYPEKVASFAFMGACVRPNTSTGTAGRLRYGFINLAMRNWAIYSRVIDFYGQRIRRKGALEHLLFNVYRPSAPDLAVIRSEHAKPHEGERMRLFFSESVQSIKHDFYHQAHPDWGALPKGCFPIQFVHGTEDMIHTLENVKELAQALGGLPVVPMAGAGQLLYYRHFPALAEKYSGFLNSIG